MSEYADSPATTAKDSISTEGSSTPQELERVEKVEQEAVETQQTEQETQLQPTQKDAAETQLTQQDRVEPTAQPEQTQQDPVEPAAEPQQTQPGAIIEGGIPIGDCEAGDDPFDDMEIPDINDPHAPRFEVGEPQLSVNAIRQRAKRIFTKRVDGSMKISETIFNEWKGKGQPRKNLEQIFKNCGYCADSQLRFVVKKQEWLNNSTQRVT